MRFGDFNDRRGKSKFRKKNDGAGFLIFVVALKNTFIAAQTKIWVWAHPETCPTKRLQKKIKLFFFQIRFVPKSIPFGVFSLWRDPPSRLLHVNQPQQPPPGPMASGGDCITPQTVASALNQNPSLSFSAFARGGEGRERSYVRWRPWIAQEGFIGVSRSRRGKGNKSGYRSE